MDLDALQQWLELVSGSAALVSGVLLALWAYTKYVLDRGLLPSTQMNVDCKFVGKQGDKKLLEILVHLKNLGTSTLISTDIRVDLRYLDVTDESTLFRSPEAPTFGRLQFPRSLWKELTEGVRMDEGRGIRIIPHDTFVQPGVDQTYSLITIVPGSTTYVLVWASFRYAQHPKQLSRAILCVSRRLGLIQYSLSHVTEPHTVERVFQVAEP